jgi:hypothetical protein
MHMIWCKENAVMQCHQLPEIITLKLLTLCGWVNNCHKAENVSQTSHP